MTVPDKVLAEKLGRTPISIRNVKSRLRGTKLDYQRSPEKDFDDRPAGWYEESIGQMLVDYEPAFAAWRHYHRYVKLEVVGRRDTVLGGLIHLRCYRDPLSE